MTDLEILPVAVIGGGPVGLAAASHLIVRGLPVKLYEAGATVATNMRDWGHVRTFSPWRYSTDEAATAILGRHGWSRPSASAMPTGAELYECYLKPLAATPELAAVIETGARVTAMSRQRMDKVISAGRDTRPFVLSIATATGLRRDLARAAIDASGTWTTPNPLGAGGLPADGEPEFSDRIAYGIPDILGRDREAYVGRTTVVVGAGHSAANVILDLARLAELAAGTEIIWATRSTDLKRLYGGGEADKLPARGELGADLKALVDAGQAALVTGFSTMAVRAVGDRLVLEGETASGRRSIGPVDRIVAVTGQRPDLSMTRELRLDLDPWLESTRALGPLIDPNEHSCGTVPPHGHRELAHPEPGFYTAGIKSYGRAPTFLMLTGYEQVRSVVAAIAGDTEAADDVQLILPETGVCEAPSGSGKCERPERSDAAERSAGEPAVELEPAGRRCCGEAA
jgi:hypothetical protein